MAGAPDLDLLATPAADRFFLVPRGTDLGAGDLELVSMGGESKRVAAPAAAAYEVTREQAEEHVRAVAERAVADVADTVTRALGIGGKGSIDLRRVAEQLGVSPRDKATTEAAIRGLSADMQAVSAAVASGRPEDLDAARARLAARGIDVGDALEGVGRLDPDSATKAAATGLRALADALEAPGEKPLGRQIDELIERFDREVGPYLGRDPERLRAQRQAKYERDARSAIAESLREAGIKPLNDPDDDTSPG
jgi:hypothetical protein